MKRGIAILTVVLIFLSIAPVTEVGASQIERVSYRQRAAHLQRILYPVGGSGVTGRVDLRQRPHNDGTHITLVAFGLRAGHTYVSLYYGNHTCALEPYSFSDQIGGIYTANAGGVGTREANVTDNLDMINSVSVRNAGDFTLLACANIHPQ